MINIKKFFVLVYNTFSWNFILYDIIKITENFYLKV